MEMSELLEQAISLHRTGRLEEAMAEYRRLLEADPKNADAHNMLGNALADLKQWAEAADKLPPCRGGQSGQSHRALQPR